MFGQDVTLWGPTHLMLIGGAGLSIVGLLLLEQEGHGGLSTDDGDRKVGQRARFIRQASAMGGLLLGMSVFQGEYDFDVPQFRLVLEPLMIAGAAGIALVAARLFMGRGGALAAAVFFVVIRGAIALIVGPAFGEIVPSFPLYLGSAIVVELLALSIPLARSPLVFGAVAGVGIGTVGHATEWGWTQFTQTLSWRSDILVEGTLMAIAGVWPAVCSAPSWRRACAVASPPGRRPDRPGRLPRRARRRRHQRSAGDRARGPGGHLRHRGRPGGPADGERDRPARPGRLCRRARLGADHLVAGRRSGRHPARADRRGRLPDDGAGSLHGTWKTLLRVHDGRVLTAMPIYLPADEALGEPEIPAEDGMTREAIPEVDILQRELKDAEGSLWTISNLVVLFCTLALIGVISWGVGRYSRRAGDREPFPDTPADPPADDETARPASELGSR
ncbi:hypothetical protein [Blastococcus brunescens]|uniref:Uncharacterized protein n=1 Tax=Blastococcus brunescens TaxID=1564165 RepID=A0ABZ1B2U6_9ACTN|nr:hypothetical protein [Blastococcus sp. BMG 8361]WRL65137.1 hypothetical protein U6N30_05495 [Blastococcus sp. BMG 8361]